MVFFNKIAEKGTYGFIKKLKKNMLLKMLVFYFAFFLAVIYFMTAVLMHNADKNLSEKVYTSNLNSLKVMQVYCDANIVHQVNEILMTMQLEIKGKAQIYRFMNIEEKITEGEIYSVYKELGDLILENPMIESIEIYNRKNRISISSFIGVQYVEDTSFYDSLYDNENTPVWTQSNGENMIVVCTFPLYINPQEKSSCVIIKINSENLIQMLMSQNKKGNDIKFFITDEDCNVLISTADEEFNVKFPQKALPNEVNEVIIDNKKYQTFYINSEAGTYKYFYVIPPTLYEKELSALRKISFWNTLSMSVLSFLGLALISLWLYRPIKEMVKTLKNFKKKEPILSDISFINEEIYNLISHVDEVNSVITKNSSLIRSQLLMEIVYGDIDRNDFSDRLSTLEYDFGTEYLVPAIICLSDKILDNIDVKQQNFILYKICELFEDIETDDCKCIATKISASSIAVLVSFSETQDKDGFFEALWSEFCELGFSDLNFIVVDEEDSFENVGSAFREMLELRKYSFVYGWGNVLKLSNLSERESRYGSESPEVISAKLEKFFELEDIDSVRRILNLFYKDCIKNEYSYDYIEKCFFSLMQVAARHCLTASGEQEQRITSDDLSTMHGIYDYIIRMINNSYSEKKPLGTNIELELIENVKQYIRNNIGGDVSQIHIASVFDISAEHLSRTFKRINGDKFSDFVTEAKLEAAAKMLCENKNITVKKAAEEVGYYNINYFTMLFKKKYYMTPSQYRKINVKK